MSEKQQPLYSEQNSQRHEINIYRIDDTLIKTFPAKPFKPHRNNYQAIIWINAGRGTHLIDDQLYEIEPNTFMLVTKDQMHAFNPKFGTLGCAIRFSDSFLDSATYHSTCKYSLFNNLTVNSVLQVNETEKPSFETLVRQLLNEYKKDDELGKFGIIQHLLEALILKLDQLKKNNLPANTTRTTRPI
ncbi:MAG: AraC family ligand binding domain-containing protein [Ignavibacteria bacterium]|nr:AraC family ligand binding domain-containing protein [Ignavibacteria bacterium]